MFGAEWQIAVTAYAVAFCLVSLLIRRMTALRAINHRTNMAADFRRLQIMVVPGRLVYFTIIILVDYDVLLPRPWYTIATFISLYTSAAAFYVG